MSGISVILCVIDPTSRSQPALQRATWLALRTGATLELAICYYNEYLSGDRFFDSRSLQQARQQVLDGYRERLETMAQPLQADGLQVRTSAVWDHPLYEAIVRHAMSVDADIVFKDTHHHSAPSRTFFTHTDWSLIRSCPMPLWLVKPMEIADKPILIAAIDPLHQHDKPAALDDAILTISRAVAESTGAEIHAFHSYDPRVALATASSNAYIPVSLPFDQIEKEMRERHEERFIEVTQFHEVDADKSHLISGRAHEELPALARELDAAVVVMGAVARSRFRRLFIGSTAERTLEELPCDLLIIKPDWFRPPVEREREDAA